MARASMADDIGACCMAGTASGAGRPKGGIMYSNCNRVWIYQPRPGDRVFAERHHPTIAVVRWADGCRHVVGGTHIVLQAAQADGGSLRAEARRVCTEVVSLLGGIAWDEQGVVHTVVPSASVSVVYNYISMVLPELKRDVDASIWRADRAWPQLQHDAAGRPCAITVAPRDVIDPELWVDSECIEDHGVDVHAKVEAGCVGYVVATLTRPEGRRALWSERIEEVS